MNTTLYIPKKINVGFNERSDTYSGLLGFVIYWDDKGKLRQENSWNNWRHKPGEKKYSYGDNIEVYSDNVEAKVLDNVPTSGFVINKQVGGTRSGYSSWDTRMEKVRVYDPRGFEFEITIPNLLFILQECTSSKGKGLEGEYVYSWAGKHLVLLPIDSNEYQECANYTALQAKKVTKNDMIPGRIYKFKDNDECIYLGRHNYFNIHTPHEIIYNDAKYGYDRKKTLYYENTSKKCHVFINANAKPNSTSYRTESGFTKIGAIINENICNNYAELLDTFLKSEYGSKIIDVKMTSTPINFDKINTDGSMYGDNNRFLFKNTEIILKIKQKYDYIGGNRKFINEYIIESVGASVYIFEDGEFRYYNHTYSNAKESKYVKAFIDTYNTDEEKNDGSSWLNSSYIDKRKFTKQQLFEILEPLGNCHIEYVFESGGTKTIR